MPDSKKTELIEDENQNREGRWMRTSWASQDSGEPPQVDRENGIIKDVAIVTMGEAKGHNMVIDEAFMEGVTRLGNHKKNGIKVRFGHPSMSGEALGTFLGRAKNFRTVDDRVKADIFLSADAKETPNGDLHSYVINFADHDPDMFGASIVFDQGIDEDPRFDEETGFRIATISKLHAADLVDDPAANPEGIFSAWSAETLAGKVAEFLDSNPAIFTLLRDKPEIVDGFLKKYNALEAITKESIMPEEKTQEELEAQAAAEAKVTADALAAAQAKAAEELEKKNKDTAALESVDPDRSDFKRMVTLFGSEKAAEYYDKGLSVEQAKDEDYAETKLHLKNMESMFSADGAAPASFSSVDDADPADKPELEVLTKDIQTQGEGRAKFMAGARKRRKGGK